MASKSNKNEFVSKSLMVHGDKYSYEKVDYVGGHKKVIVTCKVHGDFEITPCNLVAGKTCKNCAIESSAKKRTRSYDEFVEIANTVHNNKFTYQKQESCGSGESVNITCPSHGDFIMNTNSHLRGNGCKLCGRKNSANLKLLTTEEFVNRAKQVHGDKYDYRDTNYVRMIEHVSIICPVHGEFRQTAGNHLSGRGCCNCKEFGGYKNAKPGTFYIFVIDNIVKVGITNRNLARRLRDIQRSSSFGFKIYASLFSENGKIAQQLEQKSLKWLRSKYQAVAEIFDGSTECFMDVDLEELMKLIIQ